MSPSFPYLPCLLLSFVFHLSLFLGVHQLNLMASSSVDMPEEAISFVDLESSPPLSQEQEEAVPDITPDPVAEPQNLASEIPPDLSTGIAPDLAEGPAPLSETPPTLSDLPAPPPEMASRPDQAASETPQAPSDASIPTLETTPVSAEPLPESSNTVAAEASRSDPGSEPEETGQKEAGLGDAPSPSETAEPANTQASIPAQSDLSSEPSSGIGEETGDAEEEGGLDETLPPSSVKNTGAKKGGLLPPKPTKEQVKKVGLLGLLGKKNLGMGRSIRKPRRSLPAGSNAWDGNNAKHASTDVKTGPPDMNKGDKIARLRNEALREERKRLTKRGGLRSGQSSGLRIIQGSDRNYEIISASVQIKRSRLKTVYNNQLLKSPNLEGNVILEFVVSPAGTVLKCSILTSSLGNPAFEDALIKEILQWRFPNVKKGTTTILFPISFFPAG